MKTKLFFSTLIIAGLAFTACQKDDEKITKIDKDVTISLGPSYVNDVYFSLSGGVIAEVPRANWDIAFSVSTRSSSILINESAGVELKVYPTSTGWNWTAPIDITNYASWTSLKNSDIDWEVGAFNANATGHPNYGWGIYNASTHNIEGNALYIIKLRNGTYKKIWIEMKYSSMQKYTFHFANVDGTGDTEVSNFKLDNSYANFVYYSLQDNTRLDREPDASSWDLLFTKWYDNTLNYIVTGVLQNIKTSAFDVTSDNPSNITYTDSQFSTEINTIGYDWKTFNGTSYDLPTNKYFIVKDQSGNIFRINFISFAGGATGSLTFHLTEL